jgi:ATP-dependent DNA helicase RecQ
MLTDGTMLVVSPLIALMKDQVDALAAHNISATYLNSTLTPSETAFRLNGMRFGRYRLVYVAPERFRNPRFLEALAETPLRMLAIDEAHCISTWGHDFRPDYLHLEHIVSSLSPDIRIIAVTATATDDVRKDIIQHLGLGKNGRQQPEIFVTGFARPNLHLAVTRVRTHAEKLERLLQVLDTFQTGIIYCATRRAVERVQTLLKPHGHRIIAYHGAMEDSERTRVQDAFMRGDAPVVVATNAFGMGVDRADIRFVLHWDLPGSVEAYYQEVGRAGRDGAFAWCELLFSPADIHTQEFFITAATPPPEHVFECYATFRNACAQSETGSAMLSPEEWAGRAGFSSEQSIRCLMAHFERRGLILRTRNAGEPYATISVPKNADQKALQAICAELSEKAEADHARLRMMLDFIGLRSCRHRYLLHYFGEASTQPKCVRCDRCHPVKQLPPRLPLNDATRTILRKILTCIVRMRGEGDVTTAVKILRGEADSKWRTLSTYGILADQTTEQLHALMDSLLFEGCLMGMTVTKKGYDLIKERLIPERFLQMTPVTIRRPKHLTPQKKPQEGLATTLRAWVREEALRRALPHFCILNATAIANIVKKRPTTMDELLLIPGIGERRLAKYGEAILDLVRSYE